MSILFSTKTGAGNGLRAKKVGKVSGSTLNTINAETIMYPIANVPTTIRESFCFLKTLIIMVIFLEYRNVLNTLNTRNVLNNLKIFNTLNPLFIIVTDGKIDKISIIAIGVNGYRKKDLPFFCNL
jgi:hypothetical protein